jgi:hypothetical protein
MKILLHPYFLTLYGICLWQAEQAITHGLYWRTRRMFIGRSLPWAGGVVVFDDEFAEFMLHSFGVSIELEWPFYIAAGFLIDILRSKLTKTELK